MSERYTVSADKGGSRDLKKHGRVLIKCMIGSEAVEVAKLLNAAYADGVRDGYSSGHYDAIASFVTRGA